MRLPNASMRICESPRTQAPRSPPRASSTPAESACTTCASSAVREHLIDRDRVARPTSASSACSRDRLMMRPVSWPRRDASAEIRVAKCRTCARVVGRRLDRLGEQADRTDRRLQLMAGVGDEVAAHLIEALLLGDVADDQQRHPRTDHARARRHQTRIEAEPATGDDASTRSWSRPPL